MYELWKMHLNSSKYSTYNESFNFYMVELFSIFIKISYLNASVIS